MANEKESVGNSVADALSKILNRPPRDAWDRDNLVSCMTGGFQSQVNVQPAPAVQGDFASSNPRSTFDAGPGGLVSGTAGLTVGRFAWVQPPHDPDNTALLANNTPVGNVGAFGLFPNTVNVAGFVHREQQALITTFLADATMVIPQGFPVTLMTQGDFWALNSGTGPAYTGQKAFAQFSNGAVIFANAGSTPLSSTVSGSIGPVNFTITGSISGDLLTVTGSGPSVIAIGATVSGTVSGSGVAANTQITNQLSGASGGTGVYAVNVAEQTVPSGSLTITYSLLTVSATATGAPLVVGDIITATGTGLIVGTTITQFGTGTGGTGTYYLSPGGQTNALNTITSQNSVETKWYASSSGQTGELIKITSWVGSQG